MSISAPRYGSAPVALVGRTYRTLAVLRRELVRRSVWATWLVVALTYVTVTLIVTLNAEFASLLGRVSLSTFEAPYSNPLWPFLILIVAVVTGAGSLAEDFGNRSIALYLSRPIHRTDYLAAKAGAAGTWLVIAAVGPGLAGLVIVVALGLAPAPIILQAAAGFLGIGLLATLFFTGLALALSSVTTRALYAGVATFGVVLATDVGASVVSGISGNSTVLYASPISDLLRLAEGSFGLAGPFATDPVVSAILLAAAGGLLAVFAGWRLTRVEVVGE